MKTFTNYAEKKAKQFLNLLQGYTKGIRLTAILILLLMGVSNAGAATNCNLTSSGDVNQSMPNYEAGYNMGTINVWFSVNGGSYSQKGSTSSNINQDRTITNNNITSGLKFNKFSVPVYCHNQWHGDACNQNGARIVDKSLIMYWKVSNPSGTIVNEGNMPTTTSVSLSWSGNGATGTWTSQESEKDLLTSVTASTTANQTYTMDFWYKFQCHMYNNSGNDWGSNVNVWYPGNSQNFKYQFTIPKTTLTVSQSGANGGATVSSGINKTIALNTEYSLTASEVTGYDFVNWTTSNNNIKITNETSRTGAKVKFTSFANATIIANYEANQYTVKFDANGGTGSMSNQSFTYDVEEALTANAFTRTGYTFAGWNTEADGTGTSYTDEQSVSNLSSTDGATITLYAKWTINTHTVSYGVCSSTRWGSIKLNSETAITTTGTKTLNYGTAISFTASPNTGYQVVGWYSNADCTTQLQAGGNSYDAGTLTANKTVYVKFEQIPVTAHNITYTAQGTGWTYGNSNPTTAEEGATVTFVVNPTAGYRVDVSSDGPAITGPNANNQYTFTMPTKDVKITVDAKPEQYTVTLNKQSGTGGPSSVTATYLAAMPTITPPTRTGYTFNGYFDATSGGTKYYNANGSSAKNWDKTSNTTLYAQWTANTYTITYKDQGGSDFSGVHASGHPTTHTYGTATTLKDATKIGYTFDGWFTTSACTGTAVTSLGATDYTSNITLYAKWTEIPPTTIYIKSDGNYADFKWNYNSVAYDMEKVDCDGIYYTADILGGVEEITLTGSNSFTTTTLTVPTDGKTLYDLTSTNITHIYLKPNSNWTSSSAWFAAYFFGNGEKWVKMLDEDGDGIYSCEIPTDKTYPSVILVRMNSAKSALSWDSKWDQTNDLTVPTDGKNLYTVAAGAWSNGNGTWSTVWDNSRWATFEAPTLNVQVKITGKGSIVIDGETYTSITTGTETFAFTKASGENIAVGAITPEDRWALTSRQITMCDETIDLAASHTINGPATINLSFTQTSCEVVFNLNVPKGVVIPSWSIANQYVAMNSTATEPTSVGEIGDYLFGGWYKNGSTFTDANKYDFSTPVTGDLTLYARWIPYTHCIFFKNTLSWSDVYIYTFTDNAYWDNGTGVHPGTNKLEQGKMTQLDKTDIYYYILTDLTGFRHIAFSDYDMRGYELFNDHKAIYRSDRSDQMPLFIPQKDQTPTGDTYTTNKYYSSGIWMKYNSTESGYKWSSDKNSWSTDVNPFTASTKGGYTFTTTITLEGKTTYLFKINNIKNDWFGNTGTMTQDNCTKWHFTPDTDNATIQPNVTGKYVFTVYLGDGKVEVSLEYPLGINDYRLSYYDAKTGLHPGHYIKKRNEDRLDTVSFFIHTENNPELRLERCIDIDAKTSTATWEILERYDVLKTSGADPTSAQLPDKRKSDAVLYTGEGCGIETSGVYNFILKQTGNNAELATDLTHAYVGDFYIRTDAASGGWDAFRQKSNEITYSSFADDHSDFNHYFCKWILAGGNVKFTIGNDYSYCISDTLDGDDVIGTTGEHIGYLPANANVRFGWDNETNKITRAYIKGAGDKQDRFLVLQGNEHLKDIENKPFEQDGNINDNEVVFDDMGNWIYQIDVTANKDTRIKLTALYNEKTQYFKGTEDTEETILSANASTDYKLRMIYDFKSNHLICGWIADGKDVEGQQTLGADMLVIRENQSKASQIDFNKNNKMLKEVGKAYAVMTFTNQFVNNLDANHNELAENLKQPEHARAHYWISFPFDVKISEIFGFGEYGDQWILQLYDGAARAKEGYWAESEGFWRYITNKGYTLKKGVGYVLTLNLKKMKPETVFENTDEVSLYFPSTNEIHVIQEEAELVTTAPAHPCTIERDNRKIYDSHWNIIGVPGFVDISNYNTATPILNGNQEKDGGPSFYYEYLFATNKYRAEETSNTFQTMYGYMVQYTGDLKWSTTTSTPEPIAARRNSDAIPEMVTLRLELAQGEDMEDQTFVQLQQEGATAEFDMNVDMTKIINSGANIYTLVGTDRIQTAGNVLPFEETTVAVGVDIATAGEYTFRMPDGTEGMVVELIDYETNTTTNLLLDDYTVNLPTGSNETRFALSLKPEKTATSVGNIGGTMNDGQGVRKFIIDGKLYMQKDGMLYDAQGHIVR